VTTRAVGVPRAARRRLLAALTVAALGSWASSAQATGFSDHGQDLRAEPESVFDLDGYLRMRGTLLHNLDLDRGTTPSGEVAYPVPIDDPTGQNLTTADMRLRTDLAAYWPTGGMAVKARLDFLDNVALGSSPEPNPSAAVRQEPGIITVRRAWGEVLTPFGLLAAGRMGSHWGLGLLANGGDCDDCDSGDAADRVAFITPLLGHLWAVAYDFSASGPFVPARSEAHTIDLAPSANVHTITVAMLRYESDQSRRRRRRANKWTPEYGAYASHRWQHNDVPATYLPTAQPVAIDSGQVMPRGYVATAVDLWLRVTGKYARIELEAAYLHAQVDQASLIPGVLFREPVTSNQLGAALELELGDTDGWLLGGVAAGFASGDRAPGFGAFPALGAASPRAGDIDGPQARPPIDNSVDNFRFHPDYRVDRILFREIIGTVTDAGYVRPHVDLALARSRVGDLIFTLAAVASFAVFTESTPGGKRPLGVEIDPTLRYRSPIGFEAALEQATFLPLAGMDNPAQGIDAGAAQLWRLRLIYGF
jgi:uncharacterized protein (TIGR04551 family)